MAPAHDPLMLASVTAVQNPQRVEQLLAKERRPPRLVRERGQGGYGGPHAAEPAEIRFQAPDADDGRGIDFVFLLHPAQEDLVSSEPATSKTHRGARDTTPKVVVERQRELGLRLIARDDGGLRRQSIQCA
jgi:hypothetical protein